MTSTRIMLAEDDALVAECLHEILSAEPDLRVIGTAQDGPTAIRLAEVLRPDVLLLDLRLPGLDGLDVARSLRTSVPDLKIIVVTAYLSAASARALFDLGVPGVLSKMVSIAELTGAVRAVRHGGAYLGAGAAALVRRGDRDPSGATPTDRERDVLQLAMEGFSDQVVARRLGISPWTVRFHLRSLFRKLDVGSRTEMVRAAYRRGWIAE